MKRSGLSVLTVVTAAALLLGGCDTISGWFDNGGRVSKLKGTRVPVIATSETVSQDDKVKDTPVQLPAPYVNTEWPGQGGYASHAMYHLQAAGPLKEIWSADAGTGSTTKSRVTAAPVIGGGRIFTLDASARIFAFDAASGKELWSAHAADPGHRSALNVITFGAFGTDKRVDTTKAFGGGIAYDGGHLFATDGFGEVVAFDAATGKEQWRVKLDVPIMAAPAANGGRVFVTTQDNHFHAFAADDGRELWDNQGITESAGILVSTSAAVSGQFAVLPYTSGELFAVRVQNGRPAWSDMLTRTGNTTALSTLDDIAARPVIDRDMVFAVSHSGVMAAIAIDSGERAWTRDIGSIQTPWVAGDYIFVLNSESQLICLTRKEGRVKWMTQMPKLSDPTDTHSDMIVWSGPILVSDRLLLVSSAGQMMSVSPYTGKMLGQVEISGGSYIAPIVANNTVYVLTSDAELIALK